MKISFMHKENKGFSLIELAIIVIISALMLAAGVQSTSSLLEYNKYDDSKSRVSSAITALNTQFLEARNLPCPARLNALPTDADYQTSVTNCDPTMSCSAGINCTGTVAIGSLPVNTITLTKLSPAAQMDAWNNKLIYAVDRRFVQSNASASQAPGNIVVRDENNNNITSAAMFVVLSSGKDELGSYNFNGATNTTCNTSLLEGENCNNDNIFRSSRFADNPASNSYFDDIIQWQNNPNQNPCPANIPGCVLWLDANDIVTITQTAGNVTSWLNKANTAVSATAVSAPAYTAGTSASNINGKGFITFNGSNLLTASYTPPINTYTIIVAYSPASVATNQAIVNTALSAVYNTAAATEIMGIRSAGVLGYSIDNTTIVSGNNISADIGVIATTIAPAAGSYNLYKNGVLNAASPMQVISAYTNLNIGGYSGWGYFNGKLYEVVIYNTALTIKQQNAVESYLATKWSINY